MQRKTFFLNKERIEKKKNENLAFRNNFAIFAI